MVNPCYWASVSIGDSENFSENSERERGGGRGGRQTETETDTDRQKDRQTETQRDRNQTHLRQDNILFYSNYNITLIFPKPKPTNLLVHLEDNPETMSLIQTHQKFISFLFNWKPMSIDCRGYTNFTLRRQAD